MRTNDGGYHEEGSARSLVFHPLRTIGFRATRNLIAYRWFVVKLMLMLLVMLMVMLLVMRWFHQSSASYKAEAKAEANQVIPAAEPAPEPHEV